MIGMAPCYPILPGKRIRTWISVSPSSIAEKNPESKNFSPESPVWIAPGASKKNLHLKLMDNWHLQCWLHSADLKEELLVF